MSLFEKLNNKRYNLQERKKNPPPKGDGSGEPVRTNTNRNPNETIFGDNKNKKEEFSIDLEGGLLKGNGSLKIKKLPLSAANIFLNHEY